MNSMVKQRGLATVLLVLLVGISVMVITTVLAKNVAGQKEATVAAHAQTNAQMMAWAGVRAFREYLRSEGAKGATNITALNGHSVTLKSDSNNLIEAQNIIVTGCTSAGNACQISADISANDIVAKSATKINVIINDAAVAKTKATLKLSETTFSANTLITAESPNTELTINATGDLKFLVGAEFKNISKLVINATGNIEIDCGLSGQCGDTVIDINTSGTVTLSGGNNNFGIINSGSNVALNAGAEAQKIVAAGNVHTTTSKVSGDIESQGEVWLTDTTVGGNVKAYDHLILDTNSTIKKDAYINGYDKLSGINAVRLSASKIEGTVYADGNIYPMGGTETVGNAYITGIVEPDSTVSGTREENLSLTSSSLQGKIPFTIDVPNIPAANTLGTKVDVKQYKSEANYIFTSSNKYTKVFLNKLKNKISNITYYYEGGKQYYQDNGSTTKNLVGDGSGFYLGDYTIGSKTYTGAICQNVATYKISTLRTGNKCSSTIIGYLPRISVERSAKADALIGEDNEHNSDDYGFYDVGSNWRIRSLVTTSSIDNAVLAPGIMYFEGSLALAGTSSLSVVSQSALVNTLLAEGDITAISYSPIIYSPYNAVRNTGTEKEALVCNRTLKDINKSALDISTTVPSTLSDKYLMPTNLCQSDTAFAYNMDKKSDGSKDQVTIDGTLVDKLDLGKVALMANGDIRLGSCSSVYGDVLARLHLDISTTGSCGTGVNMNQIVGETSSQNAAGDTLIQNNFTAGTQIKIPAASSNSNSTIDSTIIPGSNLTLLWSKVK